MLEPDGFSSNHSSVSLLASFFSASQMTTALQLLGLDSLFESGMCYGFCILSCSSTLALALVLHQGLRVFSAPSIFHHVVNAVAVIFLFLPNNVNRIILWADDWRFLTLCSGMISLFALVQWKYSTSKKIIAQSCSSSNVMNKSHADFQSAFDCGLELLDALYYRLCTLRYLVIGIYMSFLIFNSEQQEL